jgi:hypothetical protein
MAKECDELLNANGSGAIYSTYLGGGNSDRGPRIALDRR